jgi:hypothetical protein
VPDNSEYVQRGRIRSSILPAVTVSEERDGQEERSMDNVAQRMLDSGQHDQHILDYPLTDEDVMNLALAIHEAIHNTGVTTDGVTICCIPSAVFYLLAQEVLTGRMLKANFEERAPYDQDAEGQS